MTFVTIGPNQVRSEEGYVVWMKTPSQLHYTEGNHELIVPGEMMTGVTELLVSTSTIKQWRRPEGAEPINLDTRQRITGNSGGFVAEGRILDIKGVRSTPGGATRLHGNQGGVDELVFPDATNDLLRAV